ncbi:LacI family DNA-binding transcriptional regulator [Dactylosporangium sp. NPDC051485]|uniref:LacI family DNA-binding transcriptional regulator n=1 Tax=Dactylosporangium sp. NPDC051485 TaxID=3154846 RepID=UPI0034280760
MVTSRDVAQVAGVSQATVSRVLRDAGPVKAETRTRVLEAAAQIGYQPNALARAMRTRRSGTVGVVVSHLTNPFYPGLIEELSAELGSAGCRMALWTSAGPGQDAALEAIRQGVLDGVLFTAATAKSAALREAMRAGAPAVTLNRAMPGWKCDQVVSDNRVGGQRIARYFAAAGHQRVGYIGGPAAPSTSADREKGFLSGLAAVGLALPEDYRRGGDFTYRRGREAMRELLSLTRPPTAVFCVNDLTALGALDGARSLGRAVPDDVWVVGYDDIAMASWDAFDLTTVRQPTAEMARIAVQLLLARVAEPATAPRRVTMPAELIVRGSTAHHGGDEARSAGTPPTSRARRPAAPTREPRLARSR